MTSRQRTFMWTIGARARVLVLFLVLLSHSGVVLAWRAEQSDTAIHALDDAHDTAAISDPRAVLRDESAIRDDQRTAALALEDDVNANEAVVERPLAESATMSSAVKATPDEDSKARTPDPTVTRSLSVGVASGLVLGIGCTAILAVAAAFATGRRGGCEARSDNDDGDSMTQSLLFHDMDYAAM